jgi:hypothetical protein
MSVSGPLREGSSVGMTPKGRTANMQDFARPSSANAPTRYFEPCAATASMFLYAQGSSIVCAHHDTLTIEKRFARHSDEVLLLAVDNLSELGAGRLVVSYDAGQTAIVWDIMTGDEVARFASYEHLTCAAWMKNGNVAFGEPSPPSRLISSHAVANYIQVMPRAILYSSSLRHQNTCRRGPLTR